MPQANAVCERLIGTMRRECLDWLILPNEQHRRAVLQEWVAHYNQGRPHASLGQGIPDVPPEKLARPNGHHIPAGHRVNAARDRRRLASRVSLGATGRLTVEGTLGDCRNCCGA
jgi:Integrase core domain